MALGVATGLTFYRGKCSPQMIRLNRQCPRWRFITKRKQGRGPWAVLQRGQYRKADIVSVSGFPLAQVCMYVHEYVPWCGLGGVTI